jgi:hypothetical protein
MAAHTDIKDKLRRFFTIPHKGSVPKAAAELIKADCQDNAIW